MGQIGKIPLNRSHNGHSLFFPSPKIGDKGDNRVREISFVVYISPLSILFTSNFWETGRFVNEGNLSSD